MAKLSSPSAHLITLVMFGGAAWTSHIIHVAIPVVTDISFGITSTLDDSTRHATLSNTLGVCSVGLNIVTSSLEGYISDPLALSFGHHFGLTVFGLVLSLGVV